MDRPVSWSTERLGRYAMDETELEADDGTLIKVWCLYDRNDEDPYDIGYITREDVAKLILRCLNGID